MNLRLKKLCVFILTLLSTLICLYFYAFTNVNDVVVKKSQIPRKTVASRGPDVYPKPTVASKSILEGDIYRTLDLTPVIISEHVLRKIQNGVDLPEVYGDVIDLNVVGVFEKTSLRDNARGRLTVIKSHLPLDVAKESSQNHVVCYIAQYGYRNLTIVVLRRQQNFIYVPSCGKDDKNWSNDVVPGETTMVFDTYDWRPLRVHKNLQVLIPSNIDGFLLEYNSSRYRECLRDVSASHTGRNEPPERIAVTMRALVYLKNRMKSIGLLPAMFGGTLLGWFRQCHVLKDSSDIDLALFSRDISLRLHNLLRFDSNVTGVTFNLPTDGFQYQIYIFGQKFDIYFMFDTQKPEEVYIGEWAPSKDRLVLVQTRSEVCSAILLGHRFNILCRVESVIEAEYGPNWRTPRKDWNWISSPYNLKNRGAWSDKLWPMAHVDIKTNNDIVHLFHRKGLDTIKSNKTHIQYI